MNRPGAFQLFAHICPEADRTRARLGGRRDAGLPAEYHGMQAARTGARRVTAALDAFRRQFVDEGESAHAA